MSQAAVSGRGYGVLFDLDGTLVDSAPDLAGAANALRARHGLTPLAYELLRPMVGAGARGMIGVAFGVTPEQEAFAQLRDEFLDLYEQGLLDRTCVFPDLAMVLDRLDAAGVPWGIVTNKVRRFALPLVRGLGLDQRARAVVCGDTTPHAKPHPAPLLEAARQMDMPSASCIYVGDDLRDVQAGQAAGMRTVAAAWGYLGLGEPVQDWGADVVIEFPAQLLNALDLA